MSWKQSFMLGIVSTFLASLACIIFAKIYSQAYYVDFGKIVAPLNIISSCAIGCFLMAIGYKLGIKWKGEKLIAWLNIIYSVLSFASIVGVLGFNLPLDIESPEMFAGMVIPMHFFPALSLFTIYPFFKIK